MKYLLIVISVLFSLSVNAQGSVVHDNVTARVKVTVGDSATSTGNVGISTKNPTQKLDVNGGVRVRNLTEGIVVSDNDGVLSTDTNVTLKLVVTDSLRIRQLVTDSSAHILGATDSGGVVKCVATCDTIQYILDNLGGGGYSPWDTIINGADTFIVQKNLGYNVVVGASAPVFDFGFEALGQSVIYQLNGDTAVGFVNDFGNSGIVEMFTQIQSNSHNNRVIVGVDKVFLTSKNDSSTQSYFYLIGDSTSLVTDKLNIDIPSAADGYVLTSDASGNATWQDPNVGTGWVSINDTYYTAANPFVVAAGDTANFPNRGNTSTQTQLPFGVDSLYNRADSSLIAITAGDAYLLRITFVAENTNSSGVFEIFIDIGTGGTRTLILASTEALASGPNIKNTYTFSYPYFAGATFVANGGRVLIRSVVGTTKISHINYFIERTYKAN